MFKRHVPAYDDENYPEKDKTREKVAEYFSSHIGRLPAPKIFVMPSYRALCANKINKSIPQAIFYGTDQSATVNENVYMLDDDKKIIMQDKSIFQYVRHNAGELLFDAAFIDYDKYRKELYDEVVSFADKLMKPFSVLAVTFKGRDAQKIAGDQHEKLKALAGTVTMEYFCGYRTKCDMVHAIFLLQKAEK